MHAYKAQSVAKLQFSGDAASRVMRDTRDSKPPRGSSYHFPLTHATPCISTAKSSKRGFSIGSGDVSIH